MHVDNPENSYAKVLNALLITFSLTQHVQLPTHSLGYTLDVSTAVNDWALSDHFWVFFYVSVSPHIQNRSITVRVINNHKSALIEQVL